MNDFVTTLLGEGMSIGNVLANAVWGLIGIAASIYLDFISTGRKHSEMDGQYLWKDNRERVFKSLIGLIIYLRFSSNLFGTDIAPFVTLTMMFQIDKIFEAWKDRKKHQERGLTPIQKQEL